MNRQHQPKRFLNQTAWQIGSCLTVASGLITSPVLAQSISIDGSTTTQLNGIGNCSDDCTISGGLRDGNGSGPNLFHSFSTFDVDDARTVTFTDPGVDNIFSRVTGSTLSNIDGTLKVDGTANLFLLNPNGIVFGDNAKLDIQGSFLSSTADALTFQEDTAFRASTSALPSLLTINVPVGLQFGASPNPIEIQGNGHNLTYNRNFTITRATPTTGLSAVNGQTLAFLGGDVLIQGGNLTSEAGHIEIGSLGSNASVELNFGNSVWDFDYSAANTFGDVQFSDRASLDVSGSDAGSVNIQGQKVSISGGSAILAQILGNGGGQVTVNASESFDLTGVNLSATERMPTGVYIEIAPGKTGDGSSQILVQSPSLNLIAGAQIGLGMAGSGTSGNVTVNAQSITADNGSNATPSSIFTGVLPIFGPPPGAIGQAGNLNIREAEELILTNGAQIIANTFGAGNAGNVDIDAKNIEVNGFNAGGASGIFSLSEVPIIPPLPNGSGNGGELNIRTERLTVTDGGQISVGTNGGNSAGNIKIAASESINLIGASANGRSGLFASALTGDRASSPGTGAGGNIQLNTNQLSLLSGATINASNFASVASGKAPGEGPAGNIDISASNIVLRDDSSITTDTVSGDRANINLRSESLVLRQGSNITTNATGSATGGNINIDTEALIAFENSDITANAIDNFGGRVVVNAETILGTTYREQLTPESDITASSALGPAFSGSVELNNPDVNPTDGLTELPEGLSSEDQIVAACREQAGSNDFVATGRGGLPEGASQLMTGQSIWNDFRFLEEAGNFPTPKSNPSESVNHRGQETAVAPSSPTQAIVEAQTWFTDDSGQVVLGAYAGTSTIPQKVASCLSHQ